MLAAGALGLTGGLIAARRKLGRFVGQYTQHATFTATPPLVPHDPVRDRTKIHVAKGGAPEANVDTVLAALGAKGIGEIVGTDDVVIIRRRETRRFRSPQWPGADGTTACAKLLTGSRR